MNSLDAPYKPLLPLTVPPIYAWPPQLWRSVRYLVVSLMLQWGGIFYIAVAWLCWKFLTPDQLHLATLQWWWVSLIWLRNVLLWSALAGGLYWWLYIIKGQGQQFKYNDSWSDRNNCKFTFSDQVKDNIFWSIFSSCTAWSLWEAVTLWMYASGKVDGVEWADAPVYLSLMTLATFFWMTTHFYFIHRLIHWRPLYRLAHSLHHRNVSTNPWTGIAMHPIESFIYFSSIALWWFVPVHPVVILLTGLFTGLSPALSHSGFDQIRILRKRCVSAGIFFHDLHHTLYETNYGTLLTPVDYFVGTMHDGSDRAQEAFIERRRRALKKTEGARDCR